MTLEAGIVALAEAIADDVNTLEDAIGVLSSLNTTDKTNLVAAINEVLAGAGSGSVAWGDITGKPAVIGAGATAADARTAIGAVDISAVNSAVAAVVGGAGAAYDTLFEIQGLLTANDGSLAALTTAVNNRVRYDAAQSLDSTQQGQARTNIGAASSAAIGNPDTDFVAAYEAART